MEKEIIIIGAGPSGVAAATKLVANGFQVSILEGSNRIGGRINTVPFGENVLDMGAQWCHGEKGNVVYEMAKDKHLLGRLNHSKAMCEQLIRSDGEQIATDLSKKLLELSLDLYESETHEEDKDNFNGSLGNYCAEKLNETLKTDDFKAVTPELAHECLELFEKQMNLMDAANSWYETSCQSHGYEDCEGDRALNWKDKGYVTVFDLLQNKIPGGENSQPVIDVLPLIKFNKEVIKITYNQPDGLIKLECSDGSSYSASHVICTVSLGVLKERHLNLFEPMLPLYKHKAIDGMMYGTVNKIYLEFDKPFWDEGWQGFAALWKREQIKEARQDPINGDWLEGIMGFYTFNPLQPNIICGWIVGEKAERMEQKADIDVKTGAEKVLRMFLKNQDIPDAKAIIRSKWHSNPLFRGSYTSYTLKAEALGVDIQKLAEPIADANGKPVIQFAGEATSPTHFTCVHGAIETGWREADRLIQLYK